MLSAPASAEALTCEQLEGERIAERTLVGLEHTHAYVVERELVTRVGQPLACSDWERERRHLEALDLFSEFDLSVEAVGENGVELVYDFRELPQYFIFPAMKSTDINGWMLGGGGSLINVMGHDIRADVYARTSVSPLFAASEYMLWLTAPWLVNIPVKWEFLVTQVDSENPAKQFKEESFGVELDIYQRTSLPLYILYTADLFTIAHDEETPFFEPGDGSKRRFFFGDSGRDNIPKVGFGLVLDTREQAANAHYGSFLELRWSQFGGPLGGPADYQEWLLDYRGYLSLGERHILHLSTLGQYRPGKVAPYDFFHVGGANSIRAYGVQPGNYGQHEILGTLEYRYETVRREPFELWGDNLYYGLQWVAGVDAAWLWMSDDSRPRLLSSVYAGLHILLPLIERVRIEFGIGQLEQGSDALIYGLSIGLFEKSFMQRERIR